MGKQYWIGDEEHNPPDEVKKEKFCNRCGLYKPIEEFYKRGKKSAYYAGYCKECHTKPFKYEKIVCPHCKEKIMFVGVDTKGNFIKKKPDILLKLKKEVKAEMKGKKKKVVKKEVKNLRDILK